MRRPSTELLFLLTLGPALTAFHVHFKPQPKRSAVLSEAKTLVADTDWQGRLAPDFELPLLGGGTFRLSDHVGKEVVVLNFFATWCEPCRAEIPELNRLALQASPVPIDLLGIDANEGTNLVEGFVKDLGVRYPVAVDDSEAMQRRFSIQAFPTTIVIGLDGKVQLHETGAVPNVDIVFSKILQSNAQLLHAGGAIGKEAFVGAAERVRPAEPEARGASALGERARSIAETMPCPCGCTKKVAACGCQTAKGIQERLALGGWVDKTNAQVMEELNRDFCMKGM